MADSFGLKIGLEGEKEFKKALADINQSFKVLGSEMKLATSQFDKNDKSVEALAARNKVLRKEIDFVVNDADKKIYIQSAFRMDTDKKEFFELASLMLTKDFFKKIIVRMDVPHNFYDDNGIFHCNLIDLLLGRVELF